jgi:uncharacterized membrane protein YphA (DoxX/SURF4 family)
MDTQGTRDLFSLACLLLAGVFAFAGAAKLLAPAPFARMLAGHGLPPALTPAATRAVPAAELAVAAAIVSGPLTWWGSLAALALLAGFTVAVARDVAQGRTAGCGCFGGQARHGHPLPALVRNAMLAAVAGWLVLQGPNAAGPSPLAWLGAPRGHRLVVLLAAASALAMAFGLRRRLARAAGESPAASLAPVPATPVPQAPMSSALPPPPTAGLPVGRRAPEVDVRRGDGVQLGLLGLCATSGGLLLVFAEAVHPASQEVLTRLAGPAPAGGPGLCLVLASGGAPATHPWTATAAGPVELLREYRVPAVPSAVLVLPDGRIGSRLAVGVEAIARLVDEVAPALWGRPARPRAAPSAPPPCRACA